MNDIALILQCMLLTNRDTRTRKSKRTFASTEGSDFVKVSDGVKERETESVSVRSNVEVKVRDAVVVQDVENVDVNVDEEEVVKLEE